MQVWSGRNFCASHACPQLDRARLTDELRLTLLGSAALVHLEPGGASEHLLGPGKPLALLAYLTRSPDQTASRDHLIDLLWATHDQDEGRHALRQAVWYLRQRLGGDALRAGEGVVRLETSLMSDVQSFLDAVARGHLEAAVKVYAGSYLPDLAVPGGAEFEAWAESERSRLRSLFMRSAEIVILRWLRAGRTNDARALARRVRDEDSLDETGWRLVLNVHTASGDSVTAGVEADALERLLEDEHRTPERLTPDAIGRARQARQAEAAPASEGHRAGVQTIRPSPPSMSRGGLCRSGRVASRYGRLPVAGAKTRSPWKSRR